MDTQGITTHQDIIRQTAGVIAPVLSAITEQAWTVDTSERFADHRGVYLDGPDGARLFLRFDGSYERFMVSSVWPEGAYRKIPRLTHHQISVSRDRGPDVLAREIARRLLPTYVADLADVTARVKAHADSAAADARLAEELADTVQIGRRDSDGRVTWSFGDERGYGVADVWHGGTKVALEFRSVSPDVARRVLAAFMAEDA